MKFHRTSLRLAGFYLAILMGISISFSSGIYQVSVNELKRGFQRPLPAFSRQIDQSFSDLLQQQFADQRMAAFDEARDRILARLILINLIILVGGGLLSYYLALRTLRPIEEAHEAQARFTADASHELRTPITAMRSEIEVALMDPNLTLKDAKAQLHSNVEELEKLTTLAEGLLQLAHTDNNGLPTERVPARTIADGAMERVAANAKKHGITIKSTVTEASVAAETVSATEALVTLLENAIKYSPEQSTVTLKVTQDQRSVHFAVRDKGPGIAANELPHIFDRFYRADSSRTKQGVSGYGLGLAIAKSIADAHGGSVKVNSTVGKGSTFTLTLPAADTDHA